MQPLESTAELSNTLKKYDISSITQLEHILQKRKANNDALKAKYHGDEAFRTRQKENAKAKNHQKYTDSEEFRVKQRERCLRRYYEKKAQTQKKLI